jgi:hypothetical protein
VTLVQRFSDFYYHFVMETLVRLMQVLPEVLADRSTRVLVSLRKAYAVDFLVDVIGLYPHQLIGYVKGPKAYCAKLLLVPAAVRYVA